MKTTGYGPPAPTGALLNAIDDPTTRGAATTRELTDEFLARIEASQDHINTFITVMADEARAAADAADEARAAGRGGGLLDGVVLAVKDDIDVEGVPCTVGSGFYRDRVPDRDAEVVQRVRAAGAVIVGKVGLNEFAYGVTCDNVHFGAVRNPWDPARIPGGSSGGSGAAVSADLCMAALGSDAGGSIRVPAALCGVSGLRPTMGAVSGDGTHQIAWTIETVGPIARSVADVTRLLAAIADLPAHGERTAIDDLLEGRPVGVAGLRIGVVGGFFADTSDPEIVAAVREVADELDRLGAVVGELELRDPEVAVEAGKLMIRADAFAIHEELLRSSPEGYGDDVRRRLELGADVTGADLARAHQEARGWTTQIEDAWRDFDLLLTPTVGEEAPLILGSDMIAQTEAITSLTLPFSLAGVPGLSVPCGLTSGGMPIGAQLVAPRWRDDLVLQAGAAYQQVTDWHRRRP